MKKILILISLLIPLFAFAQISTNFCPNLNSNLWYGNWNNNRDEVRELQTFLFSHYGVPTSPTGFFGRTTKYYLMQFQNENGINATGGLGPITRNVIANMCRNNPTDPVACTMQYQPVCGQELHECCKTTGTKPAYCMYAKVNCEVGSPKTFGNSCQLNAAGAKYLYDGECKNTQINEAPVNCKVWYDGCNTCSRQNVGGPMMCTLMACINNNIWNSGAYCKEYFSTNNTESPVIKSFSGPVQLRVNETGTWKVEASIFNNQQLTYNISWGDERSDYKMAQSVLPYISSVFPQNTTFEHTYSNSGTYTVAITVTAANGQSTKTTSTVNVIGNNISCYDNGISYSEGQSKSCLWVNGNQTCIADAGYVCRSGSWKIEGGFPYYR